MAVVITGNNTPTAGGITYGDGTTYANTAAGTSGQPIVSGGAGAPVFRPYTLPASDGSANQVLRTNGSGALSFATPASGLTLLSTVTASNSATVDIETTFSSTYDAYFLFVVGLVPATNASSLQCLLKVGTYISTNVYQYHSTALLANSASYAANANDNASLIQIITNVNSDSERGVCMQMNLYNAASTSTRKFINWIGSDENSSGVGRSFSGAGRVAAAPLAALTGVRFSMSSGNITSGSFRLYGLANS
jgi:hypothetical protein